MDSTPVTAYVYEIDAFGNKDIPGYLWDFGVATASGTADYPVHRVNNMELFQTVLDDPAIDAAWKANADHEEVAAEIYEYDFGMYSETLPKHASHILYDDCVWAIKKRLPPEDWFEDSIIPLTSADSYQERRTLPESRYEERIESGEIVPLLSL